MTAKKHRYQFPSNSDLDGVAEKVNTIKNEKKKEKEILNEKLKNGHQELLDIFQTPKIK